MSGASVYKMPLTMEALLRGFRGRFHEDLAGDSPPAEPKKTPNKEKSVLPIVLGALEKTDAK